MKTIFSYQLERELIYLAQYYNLTIIPIFIGAVLIQNPMVMLAT